MKLSLEDIELTFGVANLHYGDLHIYYSQDCQIVASGDQSFVGRFFLPHSPKLDHVAFHGTNGTFKVGVWAMLHGNPVSVESLTHVQRCRFLLMLSAVLNDVIRATSGYVSLVSTHDGEHEMGTTIMKEPDDPNIWKTLWDVIKEEESHYGRQAEMES